MYEFEYQRPSAQDGALSVLRANADARYLAGGQSLVQSMRLRLSNSPVLVDLADVAELRGIQVSAGTVTIGAMSTHAQVSRSAQVRRAIPALAELAGGIGDQMVRNMGTIGGSLANSDPAACYPAGVLGLGATIRTDRRSIPADEFFVDLFTTALEAGELIIAVDFPVPRLAGYMKFKQPASRFALVGVFVSQGPAGTRVAVTGARGCVFRLPAFEQALSERFAPEALGELEVSSDELNSDLHASAEYRAAMIGVMARRAVAQALAR
jgi:carbon-monoxide dehydrogenase medium subunit